MSLGAKVIGLGLRMSGMKKKYALPEEEFLAEVRRMNKTRGFYLPKDKKAVYRAHEVLEMITLDKDTKHMKTKLAVDFADLVYNGKWFTPLREALQAFAVDTQKYVTGTVKLRLYKGNIITSSVSSPCTLYSEELVTFNESDYDQKDSQGFINLWGLPDKVQALREQGKI